MSVRTRFAPSPTGYLHIGGCRTALFNYLYARRFGGQFILRVDDTDQARNVEFALKPILDGLKWLGIDWDDGPHYQSKRKDYYVKIAEELVRSGAAYPDPPNSADRSNDRKPYRGVNRNMGGDQAWALYDDTGWAIRFKVPDDERVVLDDLVRGRVEWDTNRLSDPVIVRSGGLATYNFATAVDDAELKITHVIRAEEHLSNTPLQLLILDQLGYTPPFYAHLPFVSEPNSRKKLSKRDMAKFVTPDVLDKLHQLGYSDADIAARDELNPATVTYYQCLGYKPEAVANYLARLGWSLDGKTEIMTMDTMIRNFDLDRVGGGAAQFDPKKMLWVNAEHVKRDSDDVKTLGCLEALMDANLIPRKAPMPEALDLVGKVTALCGDRIKCYSDILPFGSFVWKLPPYDKGDLNKYITVTMAQHFDTICHTFRLMDGWTAARIEEAISMFMAGRNEKPNPMVFAIRTALCGRNLGPSLYETMELLGRDECIRRMYRAMAVVLSPLGGS